MSINVSIALKVLFEKNGANFARSVSKPITLSGDSVIHNIQTIQSATVEALDLPANLTLANSLFFALNPSVSDIALKFLSYHDVVLKPNCFCLFRLSSDVTEVGAISYTADDCALEYIIVEA